jgi:predicted MFS family arabinose efflux permease
MPIPTHVSPVHFLRTTPRKRQLWPTYAMTLLLIFHGLTVLFYNSTYLGQFFSTEHIGLIFMSGSLLGVMCFLGIAKLLRIFGNFYLTILLLAADFVAIITMAVTTNAVIAVTSLLVHLLTVPLIIFSLDVFLEARIGNDESSTGSSRGLLLTLSSLVAALSPLIAGLVISEDNLSMAYILSACSIVPIIILLFIHERQFKDPKYPSVPVWGAVRLFLHNHNLRGVSVAHLVLQTFFSVMVIYMPIYLTQEIGLTLREFGVIMFIAIMAFVLLEYPVGKLADSTIGEKELMAVGFTIMILALGWISFTTTTHVAAWAGILFFSRIGAALAEVTTESYFFKQTKSVDAQIISFFRLTRPLAGFLGAAFGSLALLFIPLNLVFVAFAVLVLPALIATMTITDSR